MKTKIALTTIAIVLGFLSVKPNIAESSQRCCQNPPQNISTVQSVKLEKPTQRFIPPVSTKSCTYWDGVIDSKTKNRKARVWLKRVMRCESGCNERASNPSGASGLFQFIPNTYRGNGGVDIWDGSEQLDVTIRMYNLNQQYQWVCK